MKLFDVYAGKVAGSGFFIFVVKARNKNEAVEIVKSNTGFHLGMSAHEIKISKNNPVATIINYDDPTYEG